MESNIYILLPMKYRSTIKVKTDVPYQHVKQVLRRLLQVVIVAFHYQFSNVRVGVVVLQYQINYLDARIVDSGAPLTPTLTLGWGVTVERQ